MKEIVLASNNPGKISEFSTLFSSTGIQIIPQDELGISEVEETGLTFIENALIKARNATKISQKPAIADDSGLVVPSLQGAPGIYSARYAGNHRDDNANIDKLLYELKKIDNRHAMFICVIVYLRHTTDPLPIIAQGVWQGKIARQVYGNGGFGYDPIFYIPTLGKTAAELDTSEKNHYSHRAQAMMQFFRLFSSMNTLQQ